MLDVIKNKLIKLAKTLPGTFLSIVFFSFVHNLYIPCETGEAKYNMTCYITYPFVILIVVEVSRENTCMYMYLIKSYTVSMIVK